jgi:ABC-type cobalamin transport system ATPase subunit
MHHDHEINRTLDAAEKVFAYLIKDGHVCMQSSRAQRA